MFADWSLSPHKRNQEGKKLREDKKGRKNLGIRTRKNN